MAPVPLMRAEARTSSPARAMPRRKSWIAYGRGKRSHVRAALKITPMRSPPQMVIISMLWTVPPVATLPATRTDATMIAEKIPPMNPARGTRMILMPITWRPVSSKRRMMPVNAANPKIRPMASEKMVLFPERISSGIKLYRRMRIARMATFCTSVSNRSRERKDMSIEYPKRPVSRLPRVSCPAGNRSHLRQSHAELTVTHNLHVRLKI